MSKPKIYFRSLQNTSGSADGLCLAISFACFGTGHVSCCRLIEPHCAFAAQAYDTCPDQSIGAGFFSSPRASLFGFILLCLFKWQPRGQPYSTVSDTNEVEVFEFVEQQLLLLLAFVVLEVRDRYGQDPGQSFVDCFALEALDGPLNSEGALGCLSISTK